MVSLLDGQPSVPESVRIVRIISRLNIGGPAIQAITLTKALQSRGYQTTLVRGDEDLGEGTMDDLAAQLGVHPVRVAWMKRNPGWSDLPALVSLVRIIRRARPDIVHTHAAKGGTLGRAAALIGGLGRGRRPVLVHTFHGLSLTGYFSPRTAEVYRQIEWFLARYTDRLIAVSDEVRDDLVVMGIAPEWKFEVVPLGFDLSPFTADDEVRAQARKALRAELGIPPDARVLTLIARLAPIKRVDRFLRVANALRDLPDVRFLIVGDGQLREQLQSSNDAVALGDRVIWTGFRRDMPAVCFASDVVIQTSDNEGTPVSLIEAQAAGVPVASTRVGGTESLVEGHRFLTSTADEEGLAHAARSLLTDRKLAAEAASAGRARVLARFGLDRLASRLDELYRSLLEHRA